jgi:uracil phosphoribosyltransferase
VYRDEEVLQPVNYYESLPPGLGGSEVVVADPMLATGGSAVHALDVLKAQHPARLRFVCLVAAPEGLEKLAAAHPDVPVTTASVDDHLDERGYIRPGLGDAGDRLYGTT